MIKGTPIIQFYCSTEPAMVYDGLRSYVRTLGWINANDHFINISSYRFMLYHHHGATIVEHRRPSYINAVSV